MDALTVEERVVMFTDIFGFMMVMNSQGDDRYAFLQAIYERLGECAVEHGGEIIKYMGDAMMFAFPAGSELKAVASAAAMRVSYAHLLQERGPSVESGVEAAIGSGRVVIGEFGHASRRSRDMFGDEVNHAAMLAHHRCIGVTERAREKIVHVYETRPLPEVTVRWEAEPLKFWEVIIKRC